MIDSLHKPTDGKKPRTYRKKAHKHYLSVARREKEQKGNTKGNQKTAFIP
jgi:hypothetical protein